MPSKILLLLDQAIADIEAGQDPETVITALNAALAAAGVSVSFDPETQDAADAVDEIKATKRANPDLVTWSCRIVISSKEVDELGDPLVTTDISGRLTAEVTTDQEESAASIASFSIIPADGVLDPLLWVGDHVQVFVQEMGFGAFRLTYAAKDLAARL